MSSNFSYLQVDELAQAVEFLAKNAGNGAGGEVRVLAGGTDLLGCLNDDVLRADTVVSLSRLDELRGIRKSGGGLKIGALTTIDEIANSKTIREKYRALTDAAAAVASPQLRNQGTLGGNICQRPRCWYYRGDFDCLRKGGDTCFAADGQNQYHCLFGGDACYIVHPSDTASALLALGATVHVTGKRGERKIPVGEFFVLPEDDLERETVLRDDEIVTAVELPKPVKGLRSSYRKVRARGAWDFALAGCALAYVKTGDDAWEQPRVVLSGVAPVPWRVPAVEEILAGKTINWSSNGAEIAEAAAAAIIEGAEPLAHNAYKVQLLQGLIKEVIRNQFG